jgi:hypothetical protein
MVGTSKRSKQIGHGQIIIKANDVLSIMLNLECVRIASVPGSIDVTHFDKV